MKPKMWPREAQESFLGEVSSLEISRLSPRCGQERLKKAFLVKSLDEWGKRGSAFLVKSVEMWSIPWWHLYLCGWCWF